MKTGTIIINAAAAVMATAPPAVAAAGRQGDNSDLVIWGFLGFCALIVIGQLLPMVFSLREARKAAERQAQEASAAGLARQEARVALDKQ